MKALNFMTDEELVKVYRHGQNEAFEELLFRYKDRVFTYIYNITHDRDLADDIFQETFIKVISTIKHGRYNDSGKFIAWVSRIAHNLIIDHFRKSNGKNIISNDDNVDYDLLNNAKLCDYNIQDTYIYEATLDEVAKLMDYLPENQKEIVYMRFYKDMSFKDIADSKNISINTALGRMRYAILNMRKLAHDKTIAGDLIDMMS